MRNFGYYVGMDVKFGKIRPKNTFLAAMPVDNAGENFFESNSHSGQNNFEKNSQNPSGGRINDFDSNLLENNAYQALPDEIFKMEHKISNLEESLSKIDNEISTLEALGYDIQLYDLKNRKSKIEQELAELNSKYAELGLSSKISGHVSSVVNSAKSRNNTIFLKAKKYVAKNILSKISKTFCHKEILQDALEHLGNINSNVDELIKMQVPYGETADRYEKLTAYINRANVIHSQISKNINSGAKF